MAQPMPMTKGEVTPAQPVSVPQNIVRRFAPADLDKHGNWLTERLRAAYPHLTDRQVFSWLRGSLESNEVNIVCTPHAVGMAQVSHKPLSALVFIEEVFVFVRMDKMEKGEDEKSRLAEGVPIYQQFLAWAQSMGALEIIVERLTDIPRDQIKQGVGRMFSREVAFVKVPR
jgi:hypothetical protein